MSLVPTPCPTCGGRCCVTKRGGPADHGAAVALHACPDCKDGTRVPLLTPAPKPALTAEEERAAVVAYLRRLLPKAQGTTAKELLDALADLFERGAHHCDGEAG